MDMKQIFIKNKKKLKQFVAKKIEKFQSSR